MSFYTLSSERPCPAAASITLPGQVKEKSGPMANRCCSDSGVPVGGGGGTLAELPQVHCRVAPPPPERKVLAVVILTHAPGWPRSGLWEPLEDIHLGDPGREILRGAGRPWRGKAIKSREEAEQA